MTAEARICHAASSNMTRPGRFTQSDDLHFQLPHLEASTNLDFVGTMKSPGK